MQEDLLLFDCYKMIVKRASLKYRYSMKAKARESLRRERKARWESIQCLTFGGLSMMTFAHITRHILSQELLLLGCSSRRAKNEVGKKIIKKFKPVP